MRIFIVLISLLMSFNSLADWKVYCNNVDKIYTWTRGSDTYGVHVILDTNPATCLGGFYISQQENNRELVYSSILSAKMANAPICIQTDPEVSKISNRCRINYVMNR